MAGTPPAGVALRPATQTDQPFLLQLFSSVRWDELEPTGWTDEAKTAFLASQFEFQQRHYDNAFAGADFSVIEHDGAAIGRLSVDRAGAQLHLVEISLLPEWRGRGVGGALIGMLQAEARRGPATRIILNVERINVGAQRLYRRLGFVESPPTSPYPGLSVEMAWPAPAAAPGSDGQLNTAS